MTYKILLPQEIMAEGREYLESRGYQLINGSGMEEEDISRHRRLRRYYRPPFKNVRPRI